MKRLVDLLWEFQEMNPNDPSTWYKDQLRDHAMKELNNSGMVEIYNHQYLWDNRQYPRVYDAFVDIWDNEKLWVTIDRANLNPPNRSQRPFSGFIHWDADTTLDPLPVNVQGVLSLVDHEPEMGGFQGVPELFRTLGRVEKDSARQSRSLEAGHDRLRSRAGHAEGWRSADLQQPAGTRHSSQRFERQSAHRAIHIDDAGRRIPRRSARDSHPIVERDGAAARFRVPRRSAGVGKEKLLAGQADRAGRKVAGIEEVERLEERDEIGDFANGTLLIVRERLAIRIDLQAAACDERTGSGDVHSLPARAVPELSKLPATP